MAFKSIQTFESPNPGSHITLDRGPPTSTRKGHACKQVRQGARARAFSRVERRLHQSSSRLQSRLRLRQENEKQSSHETFPISLSLFLLSELSVQERDREMGEEDGLHPWQNDDNATQQDQVSSRKCSQFMQLWGWISVAFTEGKHMSLRLIKEKPLRMRIQLNLWSNQNSIFSSSRNLAPTFSCHVCIELQLREHFSSWHLFLGTSISFFNYKS